MKNPYPHLKLPITDPSTIDYEPAPTRPKGFIQVTRQARHIDDQGEFIEIAKRLSVSLLRSLVGRPVITQEIGYKIRQDLDSKVLISLRDFLKLREVME